MESERGNCQTCSVYRNILLTIAVLAVIGHATWFCWSVKRYVDAKELEVKCEKCEIPENNPDILIDKENLNRYFWNEITGSWELDTYENQKRAKSLRGSKNGNFD